jgi:hypothetical protein
MMSICNLDKYFFILYIFNLRFDFGFTMAYKKNNIPVLWIIFT